jgi:hypothetical protein
VRYIVSPHAQGTSEWKAARAGKATASRAKDILAKIKSGEAAARRDYRVQLVTERLLGTPTEDGFTSKEMQWGTDNEPFARMAYEAANDAIVEEAGFAYLPDIAAGCSVDGFIDGRRGFFEAKCPKSATHIAYLQGNRLPPEYVPQVTHDFWITGAEFCDFVSFDPRFPEKLQLFQVRVLRAELDIDAYETEVLRFLAETDDLESYLRKRAA